MTDYTRQQLRSLVRVGERAGAICGLAVGLLLMLGFRIDRPGERVTKLEERMSAVEVQSRQTALNVELLVRLQCLSMSRRDAQLAGACTSLPTRDESTRVYAPPRGLR